MAKNAKFNKRIYQDTVSYQPSEYRWPSMVQTDIPYRDGSDLAKGALVEPELRCVQSELSKGVK